MNMYLAYIIGGLYKYMSARIDGMEEFVNIFRNFSLYLMN